MYRVSCLHRFELQLLRMKFPEVCDSTSTYITGGGGAQNCQSCASTTSFDHLHAVSCSCLTRQVSALRSRMVITGVASHGMASDRHHSFAFVLLPQGQSVCGGIVCGAGLLQLLSAFGSQQKEQCRASNQRRIDALSLHVWICRGSRSPGMPRHHLQQFFVSTLDTWTLEALCGPAVSWGAIVQYSNPFCM